MADPKPSLRVGRQPILHHISQRHSHNRHNFLIHCKGLSLIDEGFNFSNSVGSSKIFELQSGTIQGCHWGLMGAEDLGGGFKAVSSYSFNSNNGKLDPGGLMFGLKEWIGIASDPIRYSYSRSTVRFCRQLSC
ncbi:hypothetical protein BJG93_36810 (plasmid) [Paraburkholderia sprentiae WSM5005]|uniref:Uncharacterized protein n=1 Tax=Paraburkholderia sprentiae WSM5005 TaxID=754502 RepID=A0A8F4KIP0_9BURK|nr:hypothetical protein [Paraburkholderia sprentiae]QXE07435.1 hypothetical protein BJG93_36810 [Paraburkholderia sprentiae WSM5005]